MYVCMYVCMYIRSAIEFDEKLDLLSVHIAVIISVSGFNHKVFGKIVEKLQIQSNLVQI